jgi:hypothetical protein
MGNPVMLEKLGSTLSAVCWLLSAVCCLLPAICYLLSAEESLQCVSQHHSARFTLTKPFNAA